MKPINAFGVASVLLGSFIAAGCSSSHEVAHSESDKPNWTDNGHTQKSETTYQNPDGSTSTVKSKTSTSN